MAGSLLERFQGKQMFFFQHERLKASVNFFLDEKIRETGRANN